ncbi:MAG: Hg(II)-responsive transcriptional regulator [Rhizobacter sp.]|nr:Hg(II)-responsive transcriptional regulator [Rhizobacter sp.]
MDNKLQSLTIGAVAASAEVGVETIRFYQRKGLLGKPQRPQGGIRRYGAPEVARVRFIKSAQRLGFSLEEVAGLLVLEDGTHCDDARALAEGKLADVRTRLTDLRRIEHALKTLIGRCSEHDGNICCPMIAALQSAARAQVQ